LYCPRAGSRANCGEISHEETIAVCLNFASHLAEVDLSAAGEGKWSVLLSTAMRSEDTLCGEVTLYSNEVLILERTA